MKILITGAAGFIGFHISKKLLEAGFEVIGLDNLNSYYDVKLKKARLKNLYLIKKSINSNFNFYKVNLESYKYLESIFKKHQPYTVIHLAAQAGVRYSIENPFAYIESNIVGFQNIIQLSNNFDVKNFIFASSSSVYGGNINMPFKETDEVGHPVSIYAATKRSNELIAHTYSNLYGLPVIGLRFFTVYGPWGRPDMALFLFTKAILNNEPIKVFNNGEMMRDFTYIDDVVESIFKLIKKPATSDPAFDKAKPNLSKSWAPFRIFNIGNSNPTPLMKYINAIENSLNIKAKIEYLPMQKGDVKETFSDTSALESWIEYKPRTDIKDGVDKFINWYREFYKK